MTAMRQRLLLVAGWLAAVIGSVFVASGAVAIAGGQVLDRPLRPLTAAEVAALPVAAVDSADATEPQASGGIERTTGESTVGSDRTDAGQTGPVGARGSAVPPATHPADTSEAGPWDFLTDSSSTETRVVALEAGKVSFALTEGQLHVMWVTPGAGYVAHTVRRDDVSASISFSSNRNIWVVTAMVVDGGLEVVSTPSPFA